MSLTSHLGELRVRLTRAVLAVLVASIVAAFFYDQLFELVTAPFNQIREQYAREGATVTLNFGNIGDPFTFALKICAMFGGLPKDMIARYPGRSTRAATSFTASAEQRTQALLEVRLVVLLVAWGQ